MDVGKWQTIFGRYEAASFTVNKRFGSLVKEKLQDVLTIDQQMTLSYIKRFGSCTTTELAEAFCVNKSAITAIVTRLNEKGYIHRDRDEKDRRIVYLRLTEEGEKVFQWADEKVFEVVSPYLKIFSEEEIETFLKLYEKLASVSNEGAGEEK
ncbi:MarR family winged helix-turn-helix transcriptional regulator [Fictibacillus terranigra]|uniref:MarR family transcriptional regulator n=1 Tax=Fictibacillus terranigra TaxID=3058424 RepID=A0ABT8EE49_9BACL|nr:MarR family transcriptional regulator [Fictibacillus sp. CENA-BCM004]MDN4076099.1 MarR family transcriptional regulator [Fictibacillus sp. CENA-BCM004]